MRIFGIWQLPNFDLNGVHIAGGCLLVDEYFDSEQEAAKRAVELSQGDSDYRSEELDEYDMKEHGILPTRGFIPSVRYPIPWISNRASKIALASRFEDASI